MRDPLVISASKYVGAGIKKILSKAKATEVRINMSVANVENINNGRTTGDLIVVANFDIKK